VQSNHATFEVGRRLSFDSQSRPSLIVIGVPDQKALLRVVTKLQDHNIDHQQFIEPDFDIGLSAVATVPLNEEQRGVLRNYRLWNPINNVTLEEKS
jgi:hypothetical protein